jgi:hypothetical protein
VSAVFEPVLAEGHQNQAAFEAELAADSELLDSLSGYGKVAISCFNCFAKARHICSLQQTVGLIMEKVIIRCGQGDSTSYLHEAFVIVLCLWKTKKVDTQEPSTAK